MAELADAPDLGSGVPRRAGSSPVSRIKTSWCSLETHDETKDKVWKLQVAALSLDDRKTESGLSSGPVHGLRGGKEKYERG